MKILIAVHTYYPDQNGVQAVTQYIAEGLAKKHEVAVITEFWGDTVENETVNHVQIKRIHVGKKGFWFVGEKKEYREYISQYQADVFICVCLQSWTSDWLLHTIDQFPGIKILYTHGYSAYKSTYSVMEAIKSGSPGKVAAELFWGHYYKKAHRFLRKFDRVTYLSEQDKSYTYGKIHELDNGMVLGNAVEDFFLEHSIKDRNQNNKNLLFLCVANYFEVKNQELALRAFYQSDLRECRLILVGNEKTEYYEKLLILNKELEQNFGKRNVQILTGKKRDEILELYLEADVCLISSKIEAFSIAICEAMSLGISVISTNVGNASFLPGVTVVEDSNSMAEAMKLLYEDETLRNNNGSISREYALKTFSRQQKVDLLEVEIKKIWEIKR